MKRQDDLRVIITKKEKGGSQIDIVDRKTIDDVVTGWIKYDGIVYPDTMFAVYFDSRKYFIIPNTETNIQSMRFYERNSVRMLKVMEASEIMKAYPGKVLEVLSIDKEDNTIIPYRKGNTRLTERDLYVPMLKKYVNRNDVLVSYKMSTSDGLEVETYGIKNNNSEERILISDLTISEYREAPITEYKYVDVRFKNSDPNMFMKLKLQLSNKKLQVSSKDVPKCKSILEEIDNGTVTTGLLKKFSIITGLNLVISCDNIDD